MFRRSRIAIHICILVTTLSLVVISACNKTPSDPTPGNNTGYGDLKYTITGLSDMKMERNGSVSQTINVNYVSGKLEDVLLSCQGLPKGATAKFSPISIGSPSFTTIFTITCNHAPVGVYPITVRGGSTSSGFTDYKITLTVLPYANAADGLVGFFVEKSQCSQSGSMGDTCKVEKDSTINNRIYIKGFWSGVWSNKVSADMNPTDNTLNIPVKTTNGVSFSGAGTYDDNTMIVHYRVTGSTVDDTCASTFSRVY